MERQQVKQWYEVLFENYARRYEQEPYTQGTAGECDFIEQEIGQNRKLQILDIGCGTGRHTIELARRGYNMTGVDLSESQLARAREKAVELGLQIPFLRHDARELPFETSFDLAIMLCEGGFPLMETDEMNYRILERASASLRPGGSKFIFTTLNGLFPLFHSVKEFISSQSQEGNGSYIKQTFDLMTFRDHNVISFTDDSGAVKELTCNERFYVPSEITWMLRCLGFTTIDIFGAKLGAFSREHRLTTEDFEMLVVAQK